ncbi:holin [Streptomyces sp. NPDC054871]
MMTAGFWRATTERVVRTFAQSLAAVLTAGGTDLLSVPWEAALGTAGLAAVLALLTAVATSGGTEGPGLTETVRVRE